MSNLTNKGWVEMWKLHNGEGEPPRWAKEMIAALLTQEKAKWVEQVRKEIEVEIEKWDGATIETNDGKEIDVTETIYGTGNRILSIPSLTITKE